MNKKNPKINKRGDYYLELENNEHYNLTKVSSSNSFTNIWPAAVNIYLIDGFLLVIT